MTHAPEWASVFATLIGEGPGPVLVAGYRAGDVAGSLAATMQEPISARSDTCVLIGGGGLEFDSSGTFGLPQGTVGAVVVRRLWTNAADLAAVFRDAVRVVRSGGTVVIGDVDVHRLSTAVPGRYPSQMVLRMIPDAYRRLAETSAEAHELAIEAIRTRLQDVTLTEVDETFGTFDDPDDQLRFIREGGWPVLGVVDDPAAVERTIAAYRSTRPRGPVVEREPWIYASGRTPA